MILEPGDLLVVSVSPEGGPYVSPLPGDWFRTSPSVHGAANFALGAPTAEAAYLIASEAAKAIGGRFIRIPANQLKGRV